MQGIVAMSRKRKLADDEIENILAVIQPSRLIPRDTAMAIAQNARERIKKQLVLLEIYPDIIPELKKEIERQYVNSRVEAGEAVGIKAAQSIGERQTQSTLNSFHHAGISHETLLTGVPRFKGLLGATRNPKAVSCSIYFKRGNRSIQELTKTIGNSIVHITLKNLTKSFSIVKDKEPEKWYEAFKILYSAEFMDHDHCISLQLDVAKLFEYSITLQHISEILEHVYCDIFCVFSSTEIGRLDIFVDTSKIVLPEDRVLFVNSKNAKNIYLEEVVLQNLQKISIAGVQGIRSIFYQRVEKSDEWMIVTHGSNFIKLLAHPDIDGSRTIPNDMWEIYNTLGIEAVREFLVREFGNVVGADGIYINQSHLKLISDVMTDTGKPSPISRYGIKDSASLFGKASFEECMKNFSEAGVTGEEEPLNGVSASIMCGRAPGVGTGMVELVADLKHLPQPNLAGNIVEKFDNLTIRD
jgi:DNA-directed RNA polymerase beta' subunit